MNENNKNPLRWIVTLVNWVVDALEQTLVGILDGLRNATDHASPSFFGLVAVILPFLTPAPVAYMSARSAMHFFEWDVAMAWILAISVEGLGLIAWVATVEAFLEYSRSGKGANVVWVFGGIAIVYEILLVTLNVGLTLSEGADALYAFVLFLIVCFPAMSAFYYGFNKRQSEARIAAKETEAKAEAERLRQERREDRRRAQELKLKYASETEKVRPFRSNRKT